MAKEKHIASWWLKEILSGDVRPEVARNPHAYFLKHREQLDAQRRNRLWMDRFITGVVLFAFGHFDAAEDIFGCYREKYRGDFVKASHLVRIVNDLLPLPDRLDAENKLHHAEILEWINKHKNQLHWDESSHKYFLEKS